MLNLNKRKSIFYILIIRIFILIFIFRAIQTTFLIKDEIAIQNKKMQERSQIITTEIENILAFIRSDLGNVDKNYSLAQVSILNQIKDNTINKQNHKIKLNNLLTQFNIDTLKYGLAIIKDSIIINSTHKQEIGFHFIKHLSKENKSLFIESKNKGNKNFAFIDFDIKKLGFKAYNYSILKNGNLIELTNDYNAIDNDLDYLKIRLKVLEETYNDIDYLDFWFHTKNESRSFSKTPDKYVAIFENKQSFKVDTTLGGKLLRIEHYYQPTKYSSDRLRGLSLSIIYNVDLHDQLIYDLAKNRILNTLVYLAILLIIIYIATRSLKTTLTDLLKKTSIIANGNFRERVKVKGNTEFTTLSEQFNRMVEQIEYFFNDIKQKNEEITVQRDEIEMQKDYEVRQKELIEIQKQNIVDSIDYAKQIQEAALPNRTYINEILAQNLIYFKPRDIVSGDFYWIDKTDNHLIIAAADCTGHGVPGAFMSMLGISLLNDIVQKKKITRADNILNELRTLVKSSLKQSGDKNQNKDGMDIALCSIDKSKSSMTFAGAYNPLILIRNDKILEYEADRMPVGVHFKEKPVFTQHDLKIQKNDQFYLFSDGFPDQLGGTKRTKFLSKNFKNLLLDISKFPYEKQEQILNNKLKEWMGDNDQTDDIIIVGFKIL